MLKKIIILVLAALLFVSTTNAGGLSDFSSGLECSQKINREIVKQDLTNNLCKGQYSYFDSEKGKFKPKKLMIFDRFSIVLDSRNEGVIKAIKRRGESGELALPIFKFDHICEFTLLTNHLGVEFRKGVNPYRTVSKLNDKIGSYSIIKKGSGKYHITIGTESKVNPLELCTMVAELPEVENCSPLVIKMVLDVKKMYEKPE